MFFQINWFYSGLKPKNGTVRQAADSNDSAAKQAKAAAFLILITIASLQPCFQVACILGKIP